MATPEVTRARVTAIIFGSLSCIALIAFVYAFIQQGVAKENALLAKQYMEKARHCEQVQLRAEQQRTELQKRNETLAQELLKMKDSKIK